MTAGETLWGYEMRQSWVEEDWSSPNDCSQDIQCYGDSNRVLSRTSLECYRCFNLLDLCIHRSIQLSS
jgi:hypothetical protein